VEINYPYRNNLSQSTVTVSYLNFQSLVNVADEGILDLNLMKIPITIFLESCAI